MKQLAVLIMLLLPSLISAGQVPRVCHNELSSWIKAGQTLAIVDIQGAEEFKEHNYAGALSAGSDPLRLKKIAARLRHTKGKVVVVSATGGADALQTMERLVRGGITRSRILLLEGGMEAAAANAVCDCCKPASIGNASK